MKYKTRLFLLICICLAATGCSPMEKIVNPYDENFNCKAPSDTGKCMDTPTAYKEARYPTDPDRYLDDGSFDVKQGSSIRKPVDTKVTVPVVRPLRVISPKEQVNNQRYQNLSDLLNQPETPLLSPPTILRVYLAPYTGAKGELFMQRYIYVKVKDAHWILSNVREK